MTALHVLFIVSAIALGVIWGVRATLAASRRVDSRIADGLRDIDIARWEEECRK